MQGNIIMRLTLKIAHFLLFSYFCSYQAAFGNIAMFVRPFRQEQKNQDNQKLLNQLAIPGKVTAKTIKKRFLNSNPNEGIFSTYWGYLTLSNFNGLITFPRKQQKPAFKLLITPRIKPIMMIGNTIHHWELDRSVPAELYSVERKQDAETKTWFWQTKKAEL